MKKLTETMSFAQDKEHQNIWTTEQLVHVTDTSMRLVSWFMSAGRAVLGIYSARPPAKHHSMPVRSWWLFFSKEKSKLLPLTIAKVWITL